MVLLQGLVFGRALMESLRKGTAPAATAVRSSHRNRTQRKNGLYRGFKRATNPYESKELLQRLERCSVRHLSSGMTTASSSKSLKELLKDEVWKQFSMKRNEDEFFISVSELDIKSGITRLLRCFILRIPVYRFRGIHYSVLAAKIKLALTVSSVALIPYKYWQYLDDAVSLSHLMSISAFASFTTLAFIFFCRFFNGLIGVISMNETNEYIRIGYLSFWGNRCNKYMKLDDIIPLNESSTGINSKIVRLRQYSSNETLNLALFNTELLDEERAAILFGDITVFFSSINKAK